MLPDDAAEVDPERRVQARVTSLWVDPQSADGRIYTNANGDEVCLGVARRLPMWPVILGTIASHGLALLPFA